MCHAVKCAVGCAILAGMSTDNVAALWAAEKRARAAVERARRAEARARDEHAVVIADLADRVGPTAVARQLGGGMTMVQRARERARAVRAERAAASPGEVMP